MILTGKKLEEIGKALYGRTWPTVMAHRLRRARRTLFLVRDEEINPWAGAKEQLAELLDDQLAALSKLRDELREDAWVD